MSPQVTKLVKRASGPVLIVLDGEEWDILPRGVVRKLEIAVGDAVDPATLRADADAVLESCALERGLYLVSSRERSRAESERALRRDGYPDDVVQRVANRLVEIGAIDDARFAAALTRTLAGSRGYGRRRIERQLREAGIAEDVSQDALGAHAPEGEELARALERATSLARGAGDSVDKLAARLARRGFAPGVAWRAAREVLGEQEQEYEGAGDDSGFEE